MWILSLEWLSLAITVFWVAGAWKRMQRLRTTCKSAFAALDAQFVLALEWLRTCARAEAGEGAEASAQHARHALLPSADLLELALQQARQHPLRPEAIAALDSAWQSLQVAWQAYAQLCPEPQGGEGAEAPPAGPQDWGQLMVVQRHCTAQFNAAVEDYNRAIGQFPAWVLARILGMKPGRSFQQDAALLMQQTA